MDILDNGARLIVYTIFISNRVIDNTSVQTEQSMKYMLDSIAVSVFVQNLRRAGLSNNICALPSQMPMRCNANL